MISTNPNNKEMNTPTSTIRGQGNFKTSSKKGPAIRSYKQLNVPTFAAVGFLLSFVTFQVGHSVVQSLQPAANTNTTNTVTTAPNSSDPFGSSDYNDTGSYDDGGFNSNSNNSYSYSSGAFVNPPSYSQPMPRTKHS